MIGRPTQLGRALGIRVHNTKGVTLIELLVAITLLSLLSVGMLFAMRVGLTSMGKTNDRVTSNHRVLAVERILTEQIAGFVPVPGACLPAGENPPAQVPFFQGEAQTMRFVSTYSLREAGRGYPRILEYQVIPGENGQGVRLIVNEMLYTGPISTAGFCTGIVPDPSTGTQVVLWRPVVASPQSFVLADKLAACVFSFKEERPPDQPDLWSPHWPRDSTPAAVRIDLRPLELDPARLQIPPIVAAFHVTRHALSEYSD